MPYTGPDDSLPALQDILADNDAGVLRITLRRPQQFNAITVAMALDMQRLLQAVAHDPSVRVLLLCGAGAGFSVGLDEVDFNNTALHGEQRVRTALAAVDDWQARLLRALPQPVLAMVHGVCQGAAIGIVEACDIVLAASDAQFTLPAIHGGQALSALAAKALSRVMTPRSASFHSLCGQPFDGRQAEGFGLVTRSFPVAELERETLALAAELVAKDALALQFTKDTLRHVGSMDWDAVLNFNAAKFTELKALQAGRPSPRAAAVESFLAGKSKPGLGA